MSGTDDENGRRDAVLKRMLKTPPTPHKPTGKRKKPVDADPMPDDPLERVEWARRNIQDK